MFRVVHCLQLKGLTLNFGGTLSSPHNLLIIVDFKLTYFLIVNIIITLLFCICRGLLACATVSFNSPVKTTSEVWIWGKYRINPSSIYSLQVRYVPSVIPMGIEQIVLWTFPGWSVSSLSSLINLFYLFIHLVKQTNCSFKR